MTAQTMTQPETASPWPARGRQLVAVFSLEARRALWSRRAIPVFLLAALPILLLIGRLVVRTIVLRSADPLSHDTTAFADVFGLTVIRFGLYFSCVALFAGLIRREVEERSLHYYFLCPIRREIVALGKYLAAACITALVFAVTTIVAFGLMLAPHGTSSISTYLLRDGGALDLMSFITIAVLAAVAYGALHFALGTFLRNPIFPAIAYFFFEVSNHFLPESIRLASVAHYLRAFDPFPRAEGRFFAVDVAAPPIWFALLVLLGAAAILVSVAAWRARRMELPYSGD